MNGRQRLDHVRSDDRRLVDYIGTQAFYWALTNWLACPTARLDSLKAISYYSGLGGMGGANHGDSDVRSVGLIVEVDRSRPKRLEMVTWMLSPITWKMP